MNKDREDLITGIIESINTIAIVGASPKPERPSNDVMKFLLEKGFKVYPVNPGLEGAEILEQKVYGKLSDVPAPCDMVNIFRNSDAAGEVCREAIGLMGEKDFQIIWMQLGISNSAAANEANDAGMVVIENQCIKTQYRRLIK